MSFVVFLPFLVYNDNDDIRFFYLIVPPLFSVLFCVSFTKLLFPVLLVLYGVAD
jgi:hypothetical protein